MPDPTPDLGPRVARSRVDLDRLKRERRTWILHLMQYHTWMGWRSDPLGRDEIHVRRLARITFARSISGTPILRAYLCDRNGRPTRRPLNYPVGTIFYTEREARAELARLHAIARLNHTPIPQTYSGGGPISGNVGLGHHFCNFCLLLSAFLLSLA